MQSSCYGGYSHKIKASNLGFHLGFLLYRCGNVGFVWLGLGATVKFRIHQFSFVGS